MADTEIDVIVSVDETVNADVGSMEAQGSAVVDDDILLSAESPEDIIVDAEVDSTEALDIEMAEGNGTSDHNKLYNRDLSGQHPISAITGLQTALDDLEDHIDTSLISYDGRINANTTGVALASAAAEIGKHYERAEYHRSASNTTAPAKASTDWSPIVPELTSVFPYLWQRTATYKRTTDTTDTFIDATEGQLAKTMTGVYVFTKEANDGSATVINGGAIQTGSIDVDRIQAKTLYGEGGYISLVDTRTYTEGGVTYPVYAEKVNGNIVYYYYRNGVKTNVDKDATILVAEGGVFNFSNPNNSNGITWDGSQLNIRGSLNVNSVVGDTTLGGMNTAIGTKANQSSLDTTNANVTALQGIVDNTIETWFYSGVPTLNNLPASDWTTDVLKNRHIGDLYYDNATGYAYRFLYNNDTHVYYWNQLSDSATAEALRKASQAQDTADHKKRIFVSQPTTPYDYGDLWCNTNGDTKVCTYAGGRQSGSYVASDWVKSSNYTDDTLATQVQTALTEEIARAQAAEGAAQSKADSAYGRTQSKYILTATTQYSTNGTSWSDTMPNLTSNNTLYYRYKYTWSDGSTTYSSSATYNIINGITSFINTVRGDDYTTIDGGNIKTGTVVADSIRVGSSAATAISNASTAYNQCVAIDGTGVKVRNSSNKNSAVRINSDGMEIYDDGDSVGFFGNTGSGSSLTTNVRVGSASKDHVKITSSGMEIKNNTTTYATFGSSLIELGKNGTGSKVSLCGDTMRMEYDGTWGYVGSESKAISIRVGHGKSFRIKASDSGGTEGMVFFSAIYSADESPTRKLFIPPAYNNQISTYKKIGINQYGCIAVVDTGSTRKIKHDIEPLSNDDLSAEHLYDIPVVQYKYNDGCLNESDERYGKDLVGFIAEDVEEHYPIACNHDESGEVIDWNERYIIPPMLKLIQEQHEEIEQLKSRVDELERR